MNSRKHQHDGIKKSNAVNRLNIVWIFIDV